jgi:aldose 1-epimerase
VSRGGEEHEISHGGYSAVVTAVGGGLRLLRYDGRELIRPYEHDEVRPRFRGSLLAPWPNRVVDGRYTFQGTTYQLDITEPERGHALHGLVCWSRFDLVERERSSVTAVHRVVPRTGYPFEVEIGAHYALDEDGLRCTVTAVNTGDRAAPYGVASHPYLLGGAGTVDDWTLELPVTQVLQVSEDRLLPQGLADVAGGAFDFAAGRPLRGLEVDHAFTGLVGDDDGLVRATVRGGDGHGVRCTWDPVALPWVQVHTADLAPPEPSRAGLALEPMSCPPDAFNSGVDLRVLPAGGSASDGWRVGAV